MTEQRPHPEAGRRLFTHMIDDLARDEPDRVLYEVQSSSDTKDFTHITAEQWANAVNRTSWWLEGALGKPKPNTFPTLGYTGPQDLRYLLLVIAASKTGYRMLFTSPRNSLQGDLAVIEASGCTTWLVPSRGSNFRRLEEANAALRYFSVPDMSELLDETSVKQYDDLRTWETGRRHPCWVLHTSGSTGNPKPVVRYMDSMSTVEANTLLPRVNDRPILLHDFHNGARVYLTAPFFHAAGMNNGLMWPLAHGSTIILGPSDKPVTTTVIRNIVEAARPDAIFTAPSLVEDMSKEPSLLALLEETGVRAVGYGGGPVSKVAGDRVWKYTKLRLSIGTTESGWHPCVETDPEDWNYLHLHPSSGLEMQARGAGLFELTQVRKPELERWQPVFSTFPDRQTFEYKDLFARHPDPAKPHLYTYQGRADNILVLSNGEKVQPHEMELVIGAHPDVTAALVAGQGRFQTSLLVEVRADVAPVDEVARGALVEKLWPAIVAANQLAPAHGKLHRDLIVVAHADKPLVRTAKSTVRRGPTLELYKDELDAAYVRAAAPSANGGLIEGGFVLDLGDIERFKASLLALLLIVTELSSLDADHDLFVTAALDSLQVLEFRTQILKHLPQNVDREQAIGTVTPANIYAFPSVSSLARFLFAELTSVRPTRPNGQVNCTTAVSTLAKLAEELFQKYSVRLPEVPTPQVKKSVVILTGSTGSLGSYLLDELIRLDTVTEIWCLNRSADAEARQAASNQSRGLSTQFTKVRFRHADLAQEDLSLSSQDQVYLEQNATHILHTQWQVDFNLSVRSFEPHIRGVANLVNLAARAAEQGNRIHITFTSSVGVSSSASLAIVLERPLLDWSAAGSGYGQSKLVAERLLIEAAERSQVRTTIVRVGQIAGPVLSKHSRGIWNAREWFPSIIEASAHLGLVPDTLGRNESIDWIPVDLLSTILLEQAQIIASDGAAIANAGPSAIYHAVNPHRVTWRDVVLPRVESWLRDARGHSGYGMVVTLPEWLAELQAAAARNGHGKVISAFKLLPFMTDLASGGTRPEFETEQSRRRSSTLSALPPVQGGWVDTWLKQWDFGGLETGLK